jgi:uncharacterized protein DUF6894
LPRYFFNVDEDCPSIDHEGTELPDIETARDEAVKLTGEMLRNGSGSRLWSGQSWRLWVTDQPGGAGKTLFTLRFSATEE